MTIDEAILRINQHMSIHKIGQHPHIYLAEAFGLALDALKEKRDQKFVGWISVKDRLPEKDGKYLVARQEGSRFSVSVRKYRKEVPCWYTGYCGHWERRTAGITHWMPLPMDPGGNDSGKIN